MTGVHDVFNDCGQLWKKTCPCLETALNIPHRMALFGFMKAASSSSRSAPKCFPAIRTFIVNVFPCVFVSCIHVSA